MPLLQLLWVKSHVRSRIQEAERSSFLCVVSRKAVNHQLVLSFAPLPPPPPHSPPTSGFRAYGEKVLAALEAAVAAEEGLTKAPVNHEGVRARGVASERGGRGLLT